jgi:hypothetical protein
LVGTASGASSGSDRPRRSTPEIHHFHAGAAQNPAMQDPGTVAFLQTLDHLTIDDLHRVAERLSSEALCDEVDWWRATIAIDKVVRHARRGRQAAQAAAAAAAAVQRSARRAGIILPDSDVTRIARAAADVARGLAAGPPARPVTTILLEHWEPVTAAV